MEAVVIAAFVVAPLLAGWFWFADKGKEPECDGEFNLTKAVVTEAVLRAEQIIHGYPPIPALEQKLGEAKQQTEKTIANWPQRTTRVVSETDCTPCRTGGVQLDANVLFKNVVFYWESKRREEVGLKTTAAAVEELRGHRIPSRAKPKQHVSVVTDATP